MGMEFIRKIEDIENKWDNTRNNSPGKVFSFLADSLMEEMREYDEMIHQFFSREGEEKRIRSMFSQLRNLDCEITIQTIDVSYASKVYEEYTDGMFEFIKEIMSTSFNNTSDEKFIKYEENLLKAEKNDSIFIDSLFGGINNPKTDETLQSAVSNVNFLVTFLNEMSSYNLKIEQLMRETTTAINDCNITIDSFSLAINSIAKYCAKMIVTILKTYSDINNALSGKKPDAEVCKFKIF